MAARRLILAMLFLLVVSSIIVALIPIEAPERSEDSTTASTISTSTATDAGELIVRTVSADAASPARIPMQVGDQLQLTITSSVPNQVEIEALGEFENVDPNFPARMDLFPFDTGRFAVRLLDPPGQVATIVVE
jgi:hypothetical protein